MYSHTWVCHILLGCYYSPWFHPLLLATGSILHMRVSVEPMEVAGSWESLTGCWRKTIPLFYIILINIRENGAIMLEISFVYSLN